jgi:cobalt/nickel transport system permease protein
LQPVTLASWSSRTSRVHRLDARVKLCLLLAFIISIALIPVPTVSQVIVSCLLLGAAVLTARLPLRRLLLRSLLVVPFVGPFAIILYVSGDHVRALAVLTKTYLSTSTVLLAVATTEFSKLLAAARWFRLPGMLLEVTQLIYRYFFVLASQAQQMRTAFTARGGLIGKRAFIAAAGMVAILFGRSYERAALIHHAMLARGFDGTLPTEAFPPLCRTDYVVLVGGFLLSLSLHFSLQ